MLSLSCACCISVTILIFCCRVKGIQAQTVANFYLAFEAQLTIIPVINKVRSNLPLFGFVTRYRYSRTHVWFWCVSFRLIWKMLIQSGWSHRLKRCLIFHAKNASGWALAAKAALHFALSHFSEKCLRVFFRFQLNLEQMLTRCSKLL